MNSTLRILHLEDDTADIQLIQAALSNAGIEAQFTVADSKTEFEHALKSPRFDLVLSDNRIPGFDGDSALAMARSRWPGIPFIFISGFPDLEQARKKRERTGASECVLKSDLPHLAQVIKHTLKPGSGDESELELEEYAHAMERLIAVIQDVSIARDLAQVMSVVRHAARELTSADGATFVLKDGDLCHYADEEAISPLWKGQRFPMTRCVSGWAMLNRQAAVIENIEADPRVPVDVYRKTFVKSMVIVPIRQTDPIGAIGTYWADGRHPNPGVVRILQALADCTSVAIENVTLYNNLEKKVADRTRQLQTVNQELETFSYSVSHDLRAPLRHIGSFVDLLRDRIGHGLDATSLRYLATIADAVRRMDTLIHDLLEFSRMGRATFRWSPVNMNELVAEVIDELQSSTAGRTVHWHASVLPDIEGDRSVLKQVWTNLLSNAIKYTRRKSVATITIGAVMLAGEVEYFVDDNGAGFDMQYVDRLFGVFERLHRSDEFEGSGIGLANVRRIISRHGGRTWARGQVNSGARFSFTLPRRP